MKLASPRVMTVILLATTMSGCTVWTRDDAVLLQPIPEREQVEINAGTTQVVAHALRVDSQAVSYIKYFQDPACDSCRVTVPRLSIDSVRIKTVSAPRTLLLIASIIGVAAILSQIPDDSGAY